MSTKMQVSRSPMARWMSAAVTVESTPPESPQMTRRAPTRSRMRGTHASAKPRIVQFGCAPHTRSTKLRRISFPSTECVTSGWNWRP